MDTTAWHRIEKPDYGYAISIPEGWIETPPNLRSNPWETVRFGSPEDRRHDVVVFRQPVIPGQTVADIVANSKTHLEGYGFSSFHVENVTVASRDGMRLDFAATDVGRNWSIQEYFVVEGEACFCLGFGSSDPEEIQDIIDAMLASLAILP